MESPITFKNQLGNQLVGMLHTPKEIKGGIIICHGFKDNKIGRYRLFVDLSRELCNQGFIVLRFDFSGSGDSEGEDSIMQYRDDLAKAIELISKYTSKIGLFGHSLGALITISKAKDKRVKALINLAPPLSKKLSTNSLNNFIRIYNKKTFIPWHGLKVKLKFFIERQSLKLEELKKEIKIPYLILHGEKDTIVSLDDAKTFIKDINAVRTLRVVKGGDHFFKDIGAREKVINSTIGWFNEYLK